MQGMEIWLENKCALEEFKLIRKKVFFQNNPDLFQMGNNLYLIFSIVKFIIQQLRKKA